MPQHSREAPPNTPAAALGDELDRGKGRDKIPYPDPAAAPLGTDDEAAGTPITPEQMDMARAEEIRTQTPDDSAAPAVLHGHRTDRLHTDPTLQATPAAGAGRSRLWVYAVVAVGVLVLVLLAFGR